MTTSPPTDAPADRARWRAVTGDGGRLLAAVLLLCVATVAVGWWTKARCLDDGQWTGGEEYTRWCYTDIHPLWHAERLDERAVPYLDHPVEYPVLTGAAMWLTARIAYAFPEPLEQVAFFHANALLGAAFLLGTMALLVLAGVPPSRLLWFAAAPTLAVYAFMNWDPPAVFALTAAILLHRRGADTAAGVAAGLGAAAKLFPGFLVPLVAAARLAQGRRADALRHVGAAAGAWLLVNLPVALVAPSGWARFLQLNRERPADWDSLWFYAQEVRGAIFDVGLLNVVTLLLFAGGGVALVWLGARRRDPADWWELILPLLAWFLLTNKVYSPQFSLWLLPLFVLVLPRAAPMAAFAVADLMVFVTRFAFLGGRQGLEPSASYEIFAAAVLIRAVVLLWIIALCLRERPPLASAARPSVPLGATARRAA